MSNQIYSAIDMRQYGLETVVLTEHENMDHLLLAINEDLKKGTITRIQLKKMHKKQIKKLMIEDRYFSHNPDAVKLEFSRWSEFMDNCILFSVVDFILTKRPIYLVHPSQYEDAMKHSNITNVSGLLPSLIDGIDICYMDKYN